MPNPTSFHTEFDYSGRGDDLPVYYGRAAHGTGTGKDQWTVYKFRYDSSNRVAEWDVRELITWDNRANPELDGGSAWTF